MNQILTARWKMGAEIWIDNSFHFESSMFYLLYINASFIWEIFFELFHFDFDVKFLVVFKLRMPSTCVMCHVSQCHSCLASPPFSEMQPFYSIILRQIYQNTFRLFGTQQLWIWIVSDCFERAADSCLHRNSVRV